jgi:hypothetical protein
LNKRKQQRYCLGWQCYYRTSIETKYISSSGDNAIVTPLLKQNMGCRGWQYYCHTSVEAKYGLSRVTLLLSHLCWNEIWIVEGDNTIVTPLLKQNRYCWRWQCYCHTSDETKYMLSRVKMLLSHLLKQNMDCHTSVALLSRVRMLLSHLCWIKNGLTRVAILLSHLCWIKIWVV